MKNEVEGTNDAPKDLDGTSSRADAPSEQQESEPILESLVRFGFIRSFGEGRRLISNGGVAINGIQVLDDKERLPTDAKTLRVGKVEYELEEEP